MAAVIALDAARFVIPNWLNGALLALFPLIALFVPTSFDWLAALYLFVALFVAGFALFSLNIMGGGDVKLLAVLGLYIGWSKLAVEFVIIMSLIGGALTLILLLLRVVMPALCNRLGMKSIPKILTIGAPIPYGIAIAGSFLVLLWSRVLPVFVTG